MNTGSIGPRDDLPAPQNIFNMVSSTELTVNKINAILRVVAQFSPMVSSQSDTLMVGFEGGRPKEKWDGGVVQAAENTFCVACQRLDKILENDDFWKKDSVDALVADQVAELGRVNTETARERLKQAQYQNRPCVQLKARIIEWGNGYRVVLGSDDSPIFGQGETISEALASFDNRIQGIS